MGGVRAVAERFCRDLQAPLKLPAPNERQEQAQNFFFWRTSHTV